MGIFFTLGFAFGDDCDDESFDIFTNCCYSKTNFGQEI